MNTVPEVIAAQQQAIRARCAHPSGAFVRFPMAAIEQSISDRFEQQVERYPDRLAVKTRTHAFTYAELNEAANRVAHAILELRGDTDQPVALLFGNDAPSVVASLGAAKAGQIQVPLESNFPRERLRYMLEQSETGVIVTDEAHLTLARELSALPVISFEETADHYSTANPGRPVPPSTRVAIRYTSGSTGRPKEIIRDHRAVLHGAMRLTNVLRMSRFDRVISFRGGVWTDSRALLNGAALYPVDLHQEDLTQLAGWMMQEGITVYRTAVSTFRSFVGTLTGEEAFPSLRLIFLYGEPVYHTDVERYRQHFSDQCLFASSLGTSETNDYAYFFVDKEGPIPSGVLPGGYLDESMEVLLLDENGRPVGTDEAGEIAVRLRQGGAAYWQRPDLTQAAFLPDTSSGGFYRTGDIGRRAPDGCLFYLGRKDFQVKIRGYRVDVGEVETALLALDGVKEAAVVGREHVPGDTRLVAYLVPTGKWVPRITELRRILTVKLPDYMVPSAFVILDAMPLTATGKVDRLALPPPDSARPALETPLVEPRTPMEEKLAGIWAEVLGVDQVGVHDHFLELGGDSLLATQVIARVMTQFCVHLPLHALFAALTVAAMAEAIVQMQARQVGEQKLDRMLAEVESLSEGFVKLLTLFPDA